MTRPPARPPSNISSGGFLWLQDKGRWICTTCKWSTSNKAERAGPGLRELASSFASGEQERKKVSELANAPARTHARDRSTPLARMYLASHPILPLPVPIFATLPAYLACLSAIATSPALPALASSPLQRVSPHHITSFPSAVRRAHRCRTRDPSARTCMT